MQSDSEGESIGFASPSSHTSQQSYAEENPDVEVDDTGAWLESVHAGDVSDHHDESLEAMLRSPTAVAVGGLVARGGPLWQWPCG